MSVTILAQGKAHDSLKVILNRLGEEFVIQNHLSETDEVFIKVDREDYQGKTYTKAFIFLGEYMDKPYKSPIGAEVYIGSQGGMSYLTKNGLLKERSSLTEIIRLSCKFYTGNTIPCVITLDTGLPRGRNLNIEDKLKRFLLDLGCKNPSVKVTYKEDK